MINVQQPRTILYNADKSSMRYCNESKQNYQKCQRVAVYEKVFILNGGINRRQSKMYTKWNVFARKFGKRGKYILLPSGYVCCNPKDKNRNIEWWLVTCFLGHYMHCSNCYAFLLLLQFFFLFEKRKRKSSLYLILKQFRLQKANILIKIQW